MMTMKSAEVEIEILVMEAIKKAKSQARSKGLKIGKREKKMIRQRVLSDLKNKEKEEKNKKEHEEFIRKLSEPDEEKKE